MKKRIITLILCIALGVSMIGTLSGCNKGEPTSLITGGKTGTAVINAGDLSKGNAAVSDFAVRLFQQCMKNENTLISPVSVLYALAMTANGAEGETLAQMEEVFGMSVDELNAYLHQYGKGLPVSKKYNLRMANSIWFRDDGRIDVKKEFLQTNADYYNAGVYKAPFDNSTLKEINTWVSDNTDGMIEEILNKIPENGVMYLINALAFDAEWKEVYEENDIRDGFFTEENGTTQNVEMMYSMEEWYLEDDKATGFIKHYADEKYAFVALLPKEGVSVADYVSTLDGAHLQEMLRNPENVKVQTGIPKFESECALKMQDMLNEMGMRDAFSERNADFSALGSSANGNIYINRVLHKTFISVDENGTKAGAATVIEMGDMCAEIEPEEIKTVYLDRPFVYMIIDCQTNLPVFIGTTMSAGK